MSVPFRRSRHRPDPTSMTLAEHLRELRSRLFRAALAVTAGAAVGWAFYGPLFDLVRHPFDRVIDEARASGRQVTLALSGVTDAFTLQLKIALIAGVVLSSPVWLYQLWRFVSPGLRANERRWSTGFVAVATPLFLAGCALGYAVLPRMLDVLLGFTPDNVANIVSIDYYLSFALQLLLFFGFGFLLPLVLVMLNLAGLLTGARLLSWWRGLVFGTVVFAAVATPSGDPVSMLLVALPLLGVVVLAVAVCLANDWRRRRRDRARPEAAWSDDEASPAPAPAAAPADDRPSALVDPEAT